jgi:hypothetical protein
MPVNIAFAGENTCGHTRQRVDLEWLKDSQLTTTPLPRVAENANNTLTVGPSHLVHFSSAP